MDRIDLYILVRSKEHLAETIRELQQVNPYLCPNIDVGEHFQILQKLRQWDRELQIIISPEVYDRDDDA